MGETTRMNIDIPSDVMKRLKHIAIDQGVTLKYLVSLILEEYFTDHG